LADKVGQLYRLSDIPLTVPDDDTADDADGLVTQSAVIRYRDIARLRQQQQQLAETSG